MGLLFKKPMFVFFYDTKWDSWGHIESHGDLWSQLFTAMWVSMGSKTRDDSFFNEKCRFGTKTII